MKIFAVLLLTGMLGAQVKHEDILRSPNADWLTVAGDFRGQRHSPLNQITVANANQLVPKWVHHIEKANGLRTNPTVYQGIMYVTANNEVRAIDASSGRLLWQWKDARAKKEGVNWKNPVFGL